MLRLFAFLLALGIGVAQAQETRGTSPLSIAKGGTNAATPSAARTSLGLAIGTNVEAWDADLDCLASLGTTGVIQRTGAGTCATLTNAQLTALVNLFTTTLPGSVPAPGSVSGRLLGDDGTWHTPAGGGNVSNTGTPTANQFAQFINATTIQGVSVIPATAGGSGVASPTAHTLPINEGSSAQNNTGTGTAGQALYSNGGADPSYKSGAWQLIATDTVSGGTLVDTTSISATFTEYEIVLENVLPGTTSVSLLLQVQVGGTFQSTGYLSSTVGGNGSTTGSASATNGIILSAGAAVLNTGPGLNGRYLLSNPAATLTCKWLYGNGVHQAVGPIAEALGVSGCFNGASGAITGIQVVPSTSTLTSGTMKIYGRVS